MSIFYLLFCEKNNNIYIVKRERVGNFFFDIDLDYEFFI